MDWLDSSFTTTFQRNIRIFIVEVVLVLGKLLNLSITDQLPTSDIDGEFVAY